MNMQNGKLLMAFDCFKTDASLKNAINSATELSKSIGWNAQAVSVISPNEFNWPQNFTKSWRGQFEKLGDSALTDLLKRNKTTQSFPSKILMQPYLSRKESVRSIVAEAKRTNASAIAVFTHVHQGRFGFPGGFVTSLIYKSSIPILALNTKAPALESVQTIMVATDFSPEGAKTFQKSIELAAKMKAKLILVHVLLNYANEALAASADVAGGWGNIAEYLTEEENKIRAKANRWIKKATKAGVDATFELISNSTSIYDSLLKFAAKGKVDLIIVTQKTGPLASFVLGSVTRDILSNALQPVLVMPTPAKQVKH